MKPGYLTTEFYTAIGAKLASLLVAFGVLTMSQGEEATAHVTNATVGVFAILGLFGMAKQYVQSRTTLKEAAAESPPPAPPANNSRPALPPTILPFLFAALALGCLGGAVPAQQPTPAPVIHRTQDAPAKGFAWLECPKAPPGTKGPAYILVHDGKWCGLVLESTYRPFVETDGCRRKEENGEYLLGEPCKPPVPLPPAIGVREDVQPCAWLPWRTRMEADLRAERDRNSRLMEQLIAQRNQPAPQVQPAPQIFVLPGPSAPQQQLPLGGPPQQQLPIPGAPQQQLPIPGPPQQQLPIPGAPQQQLPQPGPPQQLLPPGGAPQQQLGPGQARPSPITPQGEARPSPLTPPGEARPQQFLPAQAVVKAVWPVR